jgi:hypothetical protein
MLRSGKDGCPSLRREKKIHLSSIFLSYSGLHILDGAHHIGKDGPSFLNLLIQMLVSSRKILTVIPTHACYQPSGHPLAQLS